MTQIPFLPTDRTPAWYNERHELTVEDLHYMTFDELVEVCNSDPAHIARKTNTTGSKLLDKAFQLLKQAEHIDWLEWIATREANRP